MLVRRAAAPSPLHTFISIRYVTCGINDFDHFNTPPMTVNRSHLVKPNLDRSDFGRLVVDAGRDQSEVDTNDSHDKEGNRTRPGK
jgi:hypothetical protein